MTKFNYNQKIGLFILFLIIINIILLLINIRVYPIYNQSRTYAISGTIKPTSEWVNNKPQFVEAYYPYPLTNLLCHGEKITFAQINWSSEDEGNYVLFLTVPDAISQVILTTDCSRSVSKDVKLDKKILISNLDYGGNAYDNSNVAKGEASSVILEAQRIVSDVSPQGIKNNSNWIVIKNDMDIMGSYIVDYGNSKDTELGLKNAYSADLFAWNIRKKFAFYKLEDCLQEINILINSKKKNSCYIPDSSSNLSYNSLSTSYNSFVSYSYNEDISRLNTSALKEKIYYAHVDWQKAYNYLDKCYRTGELVNKTFEIQKPYCEAQKISKNSTIAIWFIIAIYIGILIETWRREKWAKAKKK